MSDWKIRANECLEAARFCCALVRALARRGLNVAARWSAVVMAVAARVTGVVLVVGCPLFLAGFFEWQSDPAEWSRWTRLFAGLASVILAAWLAVLALDDRKGRAGNAPERR